MIEANVMKYRIFDIIFDEILMSNNLQIAVIFWFWHLYQ